MSSFIRQMRQIPFSVFVILVATFLTNAATFMVLPFLSVYMKTDLHLPVSLIGIIIGLTFVIANGGAFIAGHYVDRMGAYPAILFGVFIRSLSFLVLAFSKETTFIFLAVQVGAVGNALYLPAARKLILQLTDKKDHALSVALSRGAENAGMGVGPLIGAAVFFLSPFYVFLSGAILFFVTVVFCAFLVPRSNASEYKSEEVYTMRRFTSVLRRRPVQWVSFLLCVHTFLYIPFFTFMPIYIKPVFGAWGISFLLAFNAISVFIFQPIFARRITSMSFPLCIFLGFGCIGLGIGLYHFLMWPTILLGTFIITIGEIIGTLRMEYTLTRLGTGFSGTMFGLMRLSFGIGGALGSVAAGFLQTSLDFFGYSPWLFWLITGVFGIFLGITLSLLSIRWAPTIPSPSSS